ncbi:MAG: FAD-binding protein, partial [Firmicutes bacterium]|nr:FAD-binding protein [Bacillota bacterium]
AEKAGAQFSNMQYLPAYPGAVPVNDGTYAKTMVANTTKYPGAIWVNLNGERMIDEIDCSPDPKQTVWATAPENYVYIIIDENMRKANPPILSYGAGFAMKPDTDWVRFNEEILKGDVVFKGETIEELAANAGIDEKGLAETVKKYNSFVKNGKDLDFGRVNSLIEFGEGPFYAVKTVPYLMLTKGGPLMDTNAQIINKAGQPIEGLYQCGELVGGANIGGAASIGGLANTICVVWGKTAARSAVEFSLSE